jgi:hypothetical protein
MFRLMHGWAGKDIRFAGPAAQRRLSLWGCQRGEAVHAGSVITAN